MILFSKPLLVTSQQHLKHPYKNIQSAPGDGCLSLEPSSLPRMQHDRGQGDQSQVSNYQRVGQAQPCRHLLPPRGPTTVSGTSSFGLWGLAQAELKDTPVASPTAPAGCM